MGFFDFFDKEKRLFSSLINKIENDDINAIKSILKKGVNLSKQDKRGYTPIGLAAVLDSMETIGIILENGGFIDDLSKDGKSALHLASALDNLEIVKFLIENNADINLKDDDDLTPVALACYSGCDNLNLFTYLIQSGGNINTKSQYNDTLLHMAAFSKSVYILDYLIEKKGLNIEATNNDGLTALHIAVEKKSLNARNILIDRGANINALTNNGSTILHLAMTSGTFLGDIKYLLRLGIDKDMKNNDNQTALDIAKEKNIKNLVKFLSRDLTSDDLNENTVEYEGEGYLTDKVYADDLKGIRELLDNNINLSEEDEDGLNVLSLAVLLKKRNIIDLILESDAFIKNPNKLGVSALAIAANEGNLELVELFVEKNVDVNAKKEEVSILNFAITPNDKCLDIIKYLLNNGLILDDETSLEYCPLHQTGASGTPKVMEFFINRGIDVNLRDIDGDTALYATISELNLDLVDILLKNNADINTKNKEGVSPLFSVLEYIEDYSDDENEAKKENARLESKCLEVMDYLLDNGADLYAKDIHGNNLLHYAISIPVSSKIISYIIKKGVPCKDKNLKGDSLLHLAVNTLYDLELIKLLISSDLDVNEINLKGKTPLFLTLGIIDYQCLCDIYKVDELSEEEKLEEQESCLEIIEFLINSGADPHIKDFEGNKVIDIAKSKDFKLIVNYLEGL